MADLTITATSVLPSANTEVEYGRAGETITAGQPVYREASTGLYKKTDSNGASAEMKVPRGIALNGGAVNQPIAIAKKGIITLGATIVAGSAYYISETPGGIQPVADLAAGENVAMLGMATSTTQLDINIVVPNVTL